MEWKSRNSTLARRNFIVCRNKYKELLELKKKKWLEGKSQFINELVKQKNAENLWKYIRNVVQKKDCLPFVSADEWLEHFRGVYN
jgi:hypothetical protein